MAAFLTLFGLMAGHGLLETARDTLFLSRLPATQLPWVYLAIAAFALFFTSLQQQRLRHLDHRWGLIGLLVTAALVSLAFWFLATRAGAWVLYALYTWSGVFITLAVIQFWSVLGDHLTITQAKRLFAVIGIGGVSGAIVGAGLARGPVERLSPAFLELPRPADPEGRSLEAILEERAEGW